MKNLGKIGLYAFSLLGILGLLWSVFTQSGLEDKAEAKAENMANAGIGFFLVVGIIVLVVTLLLFLLYKVTDVLNHPKHLKELGLIGVIILASLLLGWAIGGFGDWIETTIGAFIILLILTFGYLIFDTIKSIVK